MNQPSPLKRREIIDALRMGAVPRRGLELITIGRGDFARRRVSPRWSSRKWVEPAGEVLHFDYKNGQLCLDREKLEQQFEVAGRIGATAESDRET
jgi:hypothetical protein